MQWTYKKFIDDRVITVPYNDLKGEITGKCILNLPAYFDENPEERIALGWIKVLSDIENFTYDEQTQLCVITMEKVDEYTVREVYKTIDKSEEMMFFDELLAISNVRGTVINVIDHG